MVADETMAATDNLSGVTDKSSSCGNCSSQKSAWPHLVRKFHWQACRSLAYSPGVAAKK